MKTAGSNGAKKNNGSVKRVAILLVEDHEDTRLALTKWLNRHDYRVAGAASCAEARSLIEANKDFRLLISDVGLPDGSGYDLMVEFKKKFGANGIALTGHDREEDVAQSRASGFTTHLTKPVRTELLKIALAATLQITSDNVFIRDGMLR
jgi:DNA-binding response OmpR family regulator